MNREIERKFLVRGDAWRRDAVAAHCVQGYISTSASCGVRVRVMNDRGTLTLKGPTRGCARIEYEYPIPLDDARDMLATFCIKPLIEKTRHVCIYRAHTWEIDVFHAANDGLILAEIELEAVDEPFDLPPWIGEEVTGQPAYHNFSLVQHPFRTWNG